MTISVSSPWLDFQWPDLFLLFHFYLHSAWPREEPWVSECSENALQMGHGMDREDLGKRTRRKRAIQMQRRRSKVSGVGMQIQDQGVKVRGRGPMKAGLEMK